MWGYRGYKLLILFGILIIIEGLIFYGHEEIWQSPYVDKNNIIHYKGVLYEIKSPLGFPYREVPRGWMDEIQVKDHRYKKWINRIKWRFRKHVIGSLGFTY